MGENFDRSDISDENHANRLFNMYWEAPSDPTIYQRKLRSVQKTREKQQAARRGYNRSHSRSRSGSPQSQDGMPTVRNAFSKDNNYTDDTHSATGHMDEAINQAAARPLGSYQGFYQESTNMSSSMTQFESDQGIRLLGYGSSFSGVQGIITGPQSFSEAGNSVALPGSFNEVDFGLALRRPGVVPMGDSVTTATTTATSMSSGTNSRSTYNQSSIQSNQVGSFGSHQLLYYGNQQRRFGSGGFPTTSRSFGEGDIGPAASTTVPTVINSLHQQVVYASSQDSGIDAVPSMVLKGQMEIRADPPTEIIDDSIPKRPEPALSAKSAGEGLGDEHSQKEDGALPSINPSANSTQNVEVCDIPQAYQQQIAAMQQQFQQQQLILQQQQAALAMQQEQLRAYYSAAANAQQFGLAGAPTTAAAAVNAQQFGLAGTPATTAAAVNVQQFGLAGAPTASLNAQQFAHSGTTLAPVQPPGLSAQQFGLAGTTSGGYYLLPAADGTQILVAASNPGVPIPMSGQVPGIAPMPGILPGQIQGLSAPGAQLQGIASVGVASLAGAVPGIVDMAARMPGIPGMHPVGMMPTAGCLPGLNPTAGMAAAPSVLNNASSNTAPPSGGVYDNNSNNQQQIHWQS